MTQLIFSLPEGATLRVPVFRSVCVGYSGRNQEMVQKHIKELLEEGIPAPPEVPMAYPVSNILVTQEEEIQVLGDKTSGEVEFVLIVFNGEKYLTVGSDHTDRELEKVSIPYAKQATPKPVSNQVWRLGEVMPHWDNLQLECEVQVNGQWKKYQIGKVSAVLPMEKLIQFAEQKHLLDHNGTVLFCGTVPIFSGRFEFGEAYKLALTDPVLNRQIRHYYKVRNITGLCGLPSAKSSRSWDEETAITKANDPSK